MMLFLKTAQEQQGQRRIAPGAQLDVVVSLVGSFGANGVDYDDLSAAFPGGVEGGHGMDGSPGGGDAPEQDEFGIDEALGLGGDVAAKIQFLCIKSRGEAWGADGLGSGAQAVEHALTGIAQQAEVARVFVEAEGQGGAKSFFEVENLAGDDVDGGIPGDALPMATAAFVLDHGIEEPVFMIDGGEDLIALGTELPGGAGSQVIAGYVVDMSVTRIG